MTRTVLMTDLPTGARFIGPDERTEYEVITSAKEHRRGWVFVRNLSMTDEYAAQLLATPGAVERGCDPRNGFFCFSVPVSVQQIL